MCVRRSAVDNCTLFFYNIMCDCQSEVRSMNAKEKIEELLEASEDGTITAAQVTEADCTAAFYRSLSRAARCTASGAACMCGAAHGRTISTSCSASMGAGSTRTIPRCICWVIQTVPRQIYDDLSQGLQCPVFEAGELNHQARCAGELRVRQN